MVRKSCRLAAWIVGCAAASCSASDYSFFFTISNDVSPAQASATVTLWAAFDPQWYAFAWSQTGVYTAPDPGGLSDPMLLLYQKGGHAGKVSQDGDSVPDILVLQLQNLGGGFADTDNPVAVWGVTWSTDDFTPREVPMWTQSSDFWVYTNENGHGENFYGPDFSEAQGFITVVPAPATPALLAGAGLWSGRRRR